MLVHFSILSNPITLVKDLEQNLPSWSSYWIIIECGAIVGTSRPHPMVKTATASAAGLRTLYNFFRGENPNSCSLILGQMHHAIQGHLLLQVNRKEMLLLPRTIGSFGRNEVGNTNGQRYLLYLPPVNCFVRSLLCFQIFNLAFSYGTDS